MTARLSLENNQIRDNVNGHAAFNDADVRRGFMIDATEPHVRDALGGNFHGADGFFRANSRMGFYTVDAKFHAIGGRHFNKKKAPRIATQDKPRTGSQ